MSEIKKPQTIIEAYDALMRTSTTKLILTREDGWKLIDVLKSKDQISRFIIHINDPINKTTFEKIY